MTTLFLIAASMALLAIAAASIYSIILMKDAKQMLNQLESSVRDISEKSAPLLENSAVITGKIRTIAESVDGEVTNVKGALDSLVDAVDDLVELERKVKMKIEDPIMDTAGYVAAITKGIKAFLRVLKS
ncbi:MAG: hypothetical protein M1470_04060 [Bacteroidetes bacterium]|nr:hypothetical protein [Bacteroidota bacterium]MCL5738760.1 hypothetical protein [Bacteroidota bacterium]